ncbi:MAG: hypothetical protein KF778_01260 [Rhodocyclaceae bacterium]|nr:hypothetical protein [Rhodocyclaceae bacterium]MBX3667004.1 hypothetical protein [Rhodocyclaceae bacterium]
MSEYYGCTAPSHDLVCPMKKRKMRSMTAQPKVACLAHNDLGRESPPDAMTLPEVQLTAQRE